jgi:signal transduction histidine kinase
LENNELKRLVSLLEERDQLLLEKERDLADRNEEFISQKEELTAAIEEVVRKNAYLTETLEKLQQRNQELDQILYRASHDLKSPVTSIFGLLDLLKSEGLTPSQTLLHHHLLEKTFQMKTLLNSLSTLAQAAFDSIDIQNVPVRHTITQTVNALKDHPGFHKTNVTIDADEALTYMGDQLKLSIVIKCLLENALFFQTERESVIRMFASVHDRILTLEVHDNGEGIAPEIQDKIFNMFYRGSERSQGAGLGLYIVKSIVERLKGSISFTSSRGNTVFKISLPFLDSNGEVQDL